MPPGKWTNPDVETCAEESLFPTSSPKIVKRVYINVTERPRKQIYKANKNETWFPPETRQCKQKAALSVDKVAGEDQKERAELRTKWGEG